MYLYQLLRERKASPPPKASASSEDRPHLRLRKSLKKAAGLQYPYRGELIWVGGVLYFADTGEVVPGVPEIPKPGKKAGGWSSGQPRGTHRSRGQREDDEYYVRF